MAYFTHVVDPELQGVKVCCARAADGALDRSGLRCRFGSSEVPAWMEGDAITCCAPTREVRSSWREPELRR
jgi:hypothetical protein